MSSYVYEVFDHLHKIAEPAHEEFETSEFVQNELEKMGYDVNTNVSGTTGIIATLDSGELGPVLGVRADMDALTYEIDGEIEYRHTCGHDSHMSMLLTAARTIKKEGIKKGKLKFIFQPSEEVFTGANAMIDSGLLDDLTEVIGMHIRPKQEADFGQATPGLWHSAAAPTSITINGMNAHGARPHLGINAVDTAVLITNAINSIKLDPNITSSVKVTNLNSGEGPHNVIPGFAKMNVDIRSSSNEEMKNIIEKLKSAIESAGVATGATIEHDINFIPAADFDEKLLEDISKSIEDVVGKEGVIPYIETPGSEDFHYYAERIGCKSAYIGLGAEASPGLHHEDMTFIREAMENGANIWVNVIKNRLG